MAGRSTDTFSGGDSLITEDMAAGGGSPSLHELCNNGARFKERAGAAINFFRGGAMELKVRSAFFPGKELRISCMERDTVGELKEEIRGRWRVFVRDEITLYRSGADGGRAVEMKDNDAALSEYSVRDGAVVDAEYARADGWRRFRAII